MGAKWRGFHAKTFIEHMQNNCYFPTSFKVYMCERVCVHWITVKCRCVNSMF
uniref:Uncharacterized protein n=1 Tax=Anopheles quadriannulatus TaxID=34691 RepID=A0A182XSX5_ANOQN